MNFLMFFHKPRLFLRKYLIIIKRKRKKRFLFSYFSKPSSFVDDKDGHSGQDAGNEEDEEAEEAEDEVSRQQSRDIDHLLL